MQVQCPKCGRGVGPTQVNVERDIGYCGSCQEAFRLSEMVGASESPDVDLNNPPSGCRIEPLGNGFAVSASTRHPMAFFMVPFMCVWSGFSLGGIYGRQLVSGKFDLWISLFGVPFILGSVVFWSLTLMFIFGKVRVSVRDEEAEIFTGVGPIGRRKRFNWSDVSLVREPAIVASPMAGAVPGRGAIVLEGRRRIAFGSMLNETRRHFVVSALRQILATRR